MIKNEVLMNGRAISMNVLHSAYGLCESDNQYINKLKQRIVKQFDREIFFLSSVENNSDVIVSNMIHYGTKKITLKLLPNSLKKTLKYIIVLRMK